MATDDLSAGARHRAERRARVIDAAMRLAYDGGYESVHMREVAERSDVALGTIYRYFSGKDELLIACLVEWMRLGRQGLRLAEPYHEPPAERLARVLIEISARNDAAPDLMRALITALATTDPAAARYKRLVDQELRVLVESAVSDGSPVDVERVHRVIGHVWFSAITRWVSGLAPDGSVGRDLADAARLVLGQPQLIDS